MGGHGSGRKRDFGNFGGSSTQFSEGQKSKGILDDFSIRKNVDTAEGTIQKVPVNAKDIANKAYVDSIGGADHSLFAISGALLSGQNFALSGVTFTAGEALTGGGTLAANRTFDVDTRQFSISGAFLQDSDVDHDQTTNFVAGEHIEGRNFSISGALLDGSLYSISGALLNPASDFAISGALLDGSLYDISGASLISGAVVAILDGGGSALASGAQVDIMVPANATIKTMTLMPDLSGSIIVDIWKDSYANFPPTQGDSITSSATPQIISGDKDQDTSLTGWTTALSDGDILRFNISGAATNITRVTAQLDFVRT